MKAPEIYRADQRLPAQVVLRTSARTVQGQASSWPKWTRLKWISSCSRPARIWRRPTPTSSSRSRRPPAIATLSRPIRSRSRTWTTRTAALEAKAGGGRLHGPGQRQAARTDAGVQPHRGAVRRASSPARNVDVGALIGASNGTKELFHLASYRPAARVRECARRSTRARRSRSSTADLHAEGISGTPRSPAGSRARRESIDVASRTLLIEVDVDNPKGELLPGSYAGSAPQAADTPATTFKLPVSRRDLQGATACRSGDCRQRPGACAIVPIVLGPRLRFYADGSGRRPGPQRRAGDRQPARLAGRRPDGAVRAKSRSAGRRKCTR